MSGLRCLNIRRLCTLFSTITANKTTRATQKSRFKCGKSIETLTRIVWIQFLFGLFTIIFISITTRRDLCNYKKKTNSRLFRLYFTAFGFVLFLYRIRVDSQCLGMCVSCKVTTAGSGCLETLAATRWERNLTKCADKATWERWIICFFLLIIE